MSKESDALRDARAAADPIPEQLRLIADADRVEAEAAEAGVTAAQTIIAEVGLDMAQFPTAGTSYRRPSSRPAPSSPGRGAGPPRPAKPTPT